MARAVPNREEQVLRNLPLYYERRAESAEQVDGDKEDIRGRATAGAATPRNKRRRSQTGCTKRYIQPAQAVPYFTIANGASMLPVPQKRPNKTLSHITSAKLALPQEATRRSPDWRRKALERKI